MRPPELLPLNADIKELWMAAHTQWRTGISGAVGLDYLAVAEVARWLRVELRSPRVWRGLQALERETLRELAQKRKEQERTQGSSAPQSGQTRWR